MRVLGVIVLPAVIVLALAYGATQFVPGSKPEPQARAKGIVWAGRTFVDRAEFARWLRSRGVRYAVWARRHPALVAIPHRPAQQPVRRAAETGAGDRSSWVPASVVAVAALIALLCLVLLRRKRSRVSFANGLWVHRRRRSRVAPQANQPTPRAAAESRAHRRARRTPLKPVVIHAFTRLGSAIGPVRPRLRGVRSGLPREQPRAAARRAASAATGGARLMRRWGAATAMLCSASARSATFIAQRRRGELAWCFATAALAAGTGLLVAALLGGT